MKITTEWLRSHNACDSGVNSPERATHKIDAEKWWKNRILGIEILSAPDLVFKLGERKKENENGNKNIYSEIENSTLNHGEILNKKQRLENKE